MTMSGPSLSRVLSSPISKGIRRNNRSRTPWTILLCIARPMPTELQTGPTGLLWLNWLKPRSVRPGRCSVIKLSRGPGVMADNGTMVKCLNIIQCVTRDYTTSISYNPSPTLVFYTRNLHCNVIVCGHVTMSHVTYLLVTCITWHVT